ncbi:hypothetical protein [Vreelandella arctica]|uniref:hypothetical protein n=1 Tax=Vreelandella arctica TaxID=3126499 RepID=UPI00300E4DE3
MKISDVIGMNEYVLLTFDLNSAESKDYQELTVILQEMGFLTTFEGKDLPDNTFVAVTKNIDELEEKALNLMKEKASSYVLLQSHHKPKLK